MHSSFTKAWWRERSELHQGFAPFFSPPSATSPPVTLSIAYSPGRSDSHTFPARHLLFSCSQILHLDSAISCAALIIAQDTHFCSGLCLLSFFFFLTLSEIPTLLTSERLLFPSLSPLAPNSYFYHPIKDLPQHSLRRILPAYNF